MNRFLKNSTVKTRFFLNPLWISIVLAVLHSFSYPGGSQAFEGSDLAVSMVPPEGEAANYWPAWRGPSMQGLVSGSGYPEKWSDTENVVWRVPVPGRGHSSPIIWGDRLFLTTAAEDGSRRSVLCYNRSDGSLLWETAVPGSPAEQVHQKNSYASSSPTTDGERIYAYFGSAGLIALDFEGKVIWHIDFGSINLYHGPGGSPLLYRDRIILFQDQISFGPGAAANSGFIVAIDKDTGRELWRKSREPKPGWGSPVAVQVDDHVEIIVSSSRNIEAYDPLTGEMIWNCRGNTMEVIPMPVVGHGMVYCSSGRAGPTLAVRPGGKGDVTSSHVVWSTPKGSPFVPSPLLLGEYIYTINDMASIAACHHAKTGELIGQIRLGEPRREGFSASPVAVEGKIFFINDDGEAFVVNPAPDFNLSHINSIGERMLASPALVDGKWYFRTDSHLICIGKE